MRKFFKRGMLALALIAGMTFAAPQTANANNFTVVQAHNNNIQNLDKTYKTEKFVNGKRFTTYLCYDSYGNLYCKYQIIEIQKYDGSWTFFDIVIYVI